MLKYILRIGVQVSIVALLLMQASCTDAIDSERIPALPVNIRLDNSGLWNTYGVSGFGLYRCFSKPRRTPANFAFTETTYTGYGGVLLMGGMDPYTSETNVPLAYDMACPVECDPGVYIYIDDDNLDAVCPACGSRYNVVMGGGAPLSGPALTGKVKYRLQMYHCIPAQLGGYNIVR